MTQTQKIFQDVYKSEIWGKDKSGFCSGLGSVDPDIVLPYCRAVLFFLNAIGQKQSVVDFGCGDFKVGSRLRPYFAAYTACDIVPELIESHKQQYKDLNVDFRCIDATVEELPQAEIIIIRQVLQHLSNADILKLLPKFKKFKYIIFTDHTPVHRKFTPNLDITTGGYTRMQAGSGLDLLSHPFYLEPRVEYLLCAVPSESGIIKTSVYQMH
ncbi:class I SAM-dependent methyltransferase [Niveispirillum fermenti]|uniref:class I SAM-dependent methyltransferase n=1 Tax=Niveispirillum fermenti TaxID=1233113 RepID=UPI003A852797